MSAAVQVVTLQNTATITVSTPGMQGPPGPAGAGGGSDAYFHFHQATPAAAWVIDHNLNKYPAVTVVDSAGTRGLCSISYQSPDSLTLTFSGAFAGDAYLD